MTDCFVEDQSLINMVTNLLRSSFQILLGLLLKFLSHRKKNVILETSLVMRHGETPRTDCPHTNMCTFSSRGSGGGGDTLSEVGSKIWSG